MGNSIKEIDSYNSCVICNVKMVIISHRRTYLGIQYSISLLRKANLKHIGMNFYSMQKSVAT